MIDLYLCDIVCHGVPSLEVWKDYIRKTLQGKQLGLLTFKDKRLGWKGKELKAIYAAVFWRTDFQIFL